MNIGEHLKQWREERDLTQVDLARLLGLSSSSLLSLWERGERKPGDPELLRLALVGLAAELEQTPGAAQGSRLWELAKKGMEIEIGQTRAQFDGIVSGGEDGMDT